MQFTLKELQAFCRKLNLPVSGLKFDVKNRVWNYCQGPVIERMPNSPIMRIIRSVRRGVSNRSNNNDDNDENDTGISNNWTPSLPTPPSVAPQPVPSPPSPPPPPPPSSALVPLPPSPPPSYNGMTILRNWSNASIRVLLIILLHVLMLGALGGFNAIYCILKFFFLEESIEINFKRDWKFL